MAVGFVFVIKGADLFVSGASSLARRLHVSDLAIGLTVVAFGTSLPELAVNVTASIRGDTGITIGNILGSNIANILLILGVAGVIFPLAVTKGTIWKEIPLSLLAALLVGILANDLAIDGAGPSCLTRIDGLVLLCFFAIFLYYTAGIARAEGIPAAPHQDVQAAWKTAVLMVAGFSGLLLGSTWVVDGAVKLATSLGVRQTVIGLTIVAVGTSLPELATSAAAAYRKNPEIAIGNVVGSNIFNIFFILGVSSLIRPIPFEPRANVDIGAAIIASGLLFACMFTSKRHILDRREAALFLVLYTIYITATVVWLN
jgi:cation:H+ antiporter